MKTLDIIAGLQTLMPFYDNQNGFNTYADRDLLFCYPTDTPLSDDALDKMIEFGWFQDHPERNYKEEFSRKDYRPDETWVSSL